MKKSTITPKKLIWKDVYYSAVVRDSNFGQTLRFPRDVRARRVNDTAETNEVVYGSQSRFLSRS